VTTCGGTAAQPHWDPGSPVYSPAGRYSKSDGDQQPPAWSALSRKVSAMINLYYPLVRAISVTSDTQLLSAG